jgi:hypothetical protein
MFQKCAIKCFSACRKIQPEIVRKGESFYLTTLIAPSVQMQLMQFSIVFLQLKLYDSYSEFHSFRARNPLQESVEFCVQMALKLTYKHVRTLKFCPRTSLHLGRDEKRVGWGGKKGWGHEKERKGMAGKVEEKRKKGEWRDCV